MKYFLTFIITCFATLVIVISSSKNVSNILIFKLVGIYNEVTYWSNTCLGDKVFYDCNSSILADRAKLIYNKAGFNMLVDACDNIVSRHNSLLNGWEPHIAKAITIFTRSGDNALILGAHIGTHVLNFSKAVGKTGNVYAIDPDPLMYHFTKINVVLNDFKNAHVYNYAAFDKNTQLEFSSFTNGETNTGRSHISWDDTVENNEYRIKVTAKKIDEILSFVNKVDIILMDIEGSEPKAISGMSELLNRSSNPIIIQEWSVELMKKFQSDPREYLEAFARKKYEFAQFQDNKLIKVGIDDLLLSNQTDIVMSTNIDTLINKYTFTINLH